VGDIFIIGAKKLEGAKSIQKRGEGILANPIGRVETILAKPIRNLFDT